MDEKISNTDLDSLWKHLRGVGVKSDIRINSYPFVFVDPESRQIAIVSLEHSISRPQVVSRVTSRIIPTSKILSVEVVTIASSSSSAGKTRRNTGSMAGRAVTGGLFFGKTGAKVGALTAKQTTKISTSTEPDTVRLRVALDDHEVPVCERIFLENDREVSFIRARIEKVLQEKESLAYGESSRTTAASSAIGETTSTIADLTRLAELHSKGALTDSEFAALKKRLLEG